MAKKAKRKKPAAGPLDQVIGVAEAAEALGISNIRVRVLIREGRLPAKALKSGWVIWAPDLEKVADRPAGRPRKES